MNKKYQLVKYDSVQVPSGYIMGEISAREALLYLKAISAPSSSILKVKQIEIARLEYELAGVDIHKGWYYQNKDGDVKDASQWNPEIRSQFSEMGQTEGTNDNGNTFFYVDDSSLSSYEEGVRESGYYDEQGGYDQTYQDLPNYEQLNTSESNNKVNKRKSYHKTPKHIPPQEIPLKVEASGHDKIKVTHDADGLRDLAEKVFVMLAAFGDREAAAKFSMMISHPKEGDSLEITLPPELHEYQDRVINAINQSGGKSITDTMNEILAESNYKLVVADDVRDIVKHSLRSMATEKETGARLDVINKLFKELDMVGLIMRSGLSREEVTDEFPLLGEYIQPDGDGFTIREDTPPSAFLHVSALIPSKAKLMRRFMAAMTEGLVIKSVNDAIKFRSSGDKYNFAKEVDALAEYAVDARLSLTNVSKRKSKQSEKDKLAKAIMSVSTPSEQRQLESMIQAYEEAQGKDSTGIALGQLKSASHMLKISHSRESTEGFETNMAYVINGLTSFSTSAYVRVSSVQNKGLPDTIQGLWESGVSTEEILGIGRISAFGKASPFQRTGDGKVFFNYQGESYECKPQNKEQILKLCQDIIDNGMESGEALSNMLRVSGQFSNMKNPPVIDYDDDSAEVEKSLGDIIDTNNIVRKTDVALAKGLKQIHELMSSGFDVKNAYSSKNKVVEQMHRLKGEEGESIVLSIRANVLLSVTGQVSAHNADQIADFAEYQTRKLIHDYADYMLDKANTQSLRATREKGISSGKSMGGIFEGISDISLMVQKVNSLGVGDTINIPRDTDGKPQVMIYMRGHDIDPQRISENNHVPVQGTLFEVRDLNGATKERCFVGKDIRSSGSIDSFLMSARGDELRFMTSETKIYDKSVAYGHFNAPDQFASFVGSVGRNYRRITMTNTTNKAYMYGRSESLQENSHSDKLTFKAYPSIEDGGENSAVLSGVPRYNDGSSVDHDKPASLGGAKFTYNDKQRIAPYRKRKGSV